MGKTTIDVSGSTYAGEYSMKDLQATALLSPQFVERGLITVIDNLKGPLTMQNVDDTVEFIDPACDFAGQTNTVTPTERVLNPVKYEVHKEYCFESLETDWRAKGLAPGSLNDYNDPQLQDFLLSRTLEKIALANEELYINGKAGVTSATASFTAGYTGFIPAVKADGSTLKSDLTEWEVTVTNITVANPAVVTVADATNLKVGDKISFVSIGGMTEINGESATIVSISGTDLTTDKDTSSGYTAFSAGGDDAIQFINRSNVIEVLAQIARKEILPALRRDPSLKMVIPWYVGACYKEAQATNATGSGSFWVGDRELDFLGRIMEPMDVWAENTILVYKASDVYLGVDLLGDASSARITDLRQTTGDDKTRVKLSMKSDVNYRHPNEIFVMRPN